MKSAVNVTRKDGGLGLTAAAGLNTQVKIGVCTAGTVGSVIALASPEDVADKLGHGPLARACYDSMQLGATGIIAIPAAASTAGTKSDVTLTGTGKATYAVTGEPNDDYDIVIRIAKGGTVNEAQYELSVDGGDNFEPKKTVPTNGAVAIGTTGLTITFTPDAESAEESFVQGDTYTLTATAPQMTQADFLAATAVMKASNLKYEFVHVVGASAAALWAAGASEATLIESQYKTPVFFVFETRKPTDEETVDEWVAALIADRGSFASPDVCVVAGRLEISGLDKTVRDTNGAADFAGILGISRVHESPGKVMSFAIPNAIKLLPEGLNDTHINQLDDAKFVTFCTYPNYSGIYVTNGKTMAADGSDYKYIETRRVVNKYYRLIQQAAMFYVQSEASEDDLPGFKAHLEAAGDKMADADPREIVSHKIVIPDGQDILSSETIKVKCSLVPVPIMRTIDIDLQLTNPFAAS